MAQFTALAATETAWLVFDSSTMTTGMTSAAATSIGTSKARSIRSKRCCPARCAIAVRWANPLPECRCTAALQQPPTLDPGVVRGTQEFTALPADRDSDPSLYATRGPKNELAPRHGVRVAD